MPAVMNRLEVGNGSQEGEERGRNTGKEDGGKWVGEKGGLQELSWHVRLS